MNFKSQIATTREQSERLLALGLKPGTADMSIPIKDNPNLNCSARPYNDWNGYWKHNKFVIPAWSLSRLLEMMPTDIKDLWYSLYIDTEIAVYRVSYSTNEGNSGLQTLIKFDNNNLFDAIIEMISWLIANDYFDKEYLKGETK